MMLYGVCTGTGRESPYVPAFFCIEQASQSLPDGAKAYDTAGNCGGRGKVRTCDPTRVKAEGDLSLSASDKRKLQENSGAAYPNCTSAA